MISQIELWYSSNILMFPLLIFYQHLFLPDIVTGKMDEVLGEFSVDLDARFSSIRTQETNIGNILYFI